MKQPEEFDKYIKRLLEEEPKVPTDLKWEEMDIKIPKPQKHNWFYQRNFLLGILFLTMVSASLLLNWWTTESTVKVEEAVVAYNISKEQTEQISKDEITETEVSSVLNETTSAEHNSLSKTQQSAGNNSSSQLLKFRQNATLQSAATQTPSNQWVEILSNDSGSQEINNSVKFNSSTVVNTSIVNKRFVAMQLWNVINMPIDILLIPMKDQYLITQNYNTKSIDSSFVEMPASKKAKQFLIGFGSNNFNMTVPGASELKGKVKSAFGQSLQIGWKSQIKPQLWFSAVLSLDRFHSTFDYSRKLPNEVDLDRNVTIKRTEITFHNNYTNLTSLQLQLQKQFKLTNKLSAWAGLGLNPGIAISASGKTIGATEVVYLNLEESTDKFVLAGQIQLGLSYPINEKYELMGSVQASQSLLNKIIINGDVHTRQYGSANLMLIRKF